MSSNLAYPTMYRAIFIDIDDTLLDYIPCCREAFEFALPEHPEYFDLFFEISGRLFSEAKHGLHTIAEVMELYPKEFIATIGYPPEAVDPFKHAFRAAWGTTHTLVPGAKETLEVLHKKGYRLIYWDILTRDYDKNVTPEQMLAQIKRDTRPGSIINFHDSLKSNERMLAVLPQAIEWLKAQGYELKPL